MKDINIFLTEASNKDGMFMGKTSKRTEEGFTFEKGEKVLLIKYTTHRYIAQLRSANYYVSKVGKNSITIASDDPDYQSTIDTLKFKFDKYGIYVNKNKNKYTGNETLYWVLYNKALADDKDIQELLDKGNCSWGFKFSDKDEDKERLQGYINEINKA